MLRKSACALCFLATAVLVLSGCYHATVDTGRAPNGVQIEKKWANSFIYGLVPPAIVETASQCPNGLATVDTQLSFLNQVVSAVTFGIYTPMEIIVACAGGTASVDGPSITAGSSEADRISAMEEAAEVTRETQSTVYLQF